MKWYRQTKRFFREYIFKNLFPYYYKYYDTYKDESGSGILERFISVCSEYLDESVMPDVDNIMDILDVDRTSPIFLNYLWEYFGYIPYAYGVLTRGEPYTEANLEKWLKEDRGYPTADARQVLKYAISLYKIRGTDLFYRVLGRFYDVVFQIVDPTQNNPVILPDSRSVSYNQGFIFDDVASQYDKETDCWECVPCELTISIPKYQWEYMQEKNWEIQDAIVKDWMERNPNACDTEITEYRATVESEHSSDYSDKAKEALVGIVNLYLPVNVKEFKVENAQVTIQQYTVTIYISNS